MASFLLVILAFPVLISANIVIPFQQTVVRHDLVRHDQSWNNTFSFPLETHACPLYYTLKIKFGNPSKEFTLLMDTGSNDIWIGCKSNNGCPSSNKIIRDTIVFDPIVFDPEASSIASILPCSDKLCSHCSQNNQCTYDIQYCVSATTSGYYVKDMVFYDKGANSSAPFVFGCSTYCSRVLSSYYQRMDGILGLGPGSASFVSQLSALHKIPRVFSQCLMRDGGGGALIFGNVSEPSIVYSPIDSTEEHNYTINVDSIFVGEKELPIATKYSKVMIDSGLYTGFLVKEIYDSFVDAINATAAKYTTLNLSKKTYCFDDFDMNKPLDQMFPTLTYKFKGGLTIVLRPEKYLLLRAMAEGQYKTWCIGIVEDTINTIGNIFLQDKIVVYDYDQKRIGMANYDCSLLSTSAGTSLQMFPFQLYYILAILLIIHRF